MIMFVSWSKAKKKSKSVENSMMFLEYLAVIISKLFLKARTVKIASKTHENCNISKCSVWLFNENIEFKTLIASSHSLALKKTHAMLIKLKVMNHANHFHSLKPKEDQKR